MITTINSGSETLEWPSTPLLAIHIVVRGTHYKGRFRRPNTTESILGSTVLCGIHQGFALTVIMGLDIIPEFLNNQLWFRIQRFKKNVIYPDSREANENQKIWLFFSYDRYNMNILNLFLFLHLSLTPASLAPLPLCTSKEYPLKLWMTKSLYSLCTCPEVL